MLSDDIRYLNDRLREKSGDRIIGGDLGLKKVMHLVSQVAGMDSPVLITGESGVGKEMIADAIHSASHRKNGPFIKVNCGAIPESLMDSELFGHEKGAFTGASAQKRGRFERADHGTIFLDEIGELSPQAQIRLLRVLQEKRIERVGGTKEISVNVRIISATHRDLRDMVAKGEFREDLWFRINVFPIHIPPLRERKEDIPALAEYFIEKKTLELKLKKRPDLQVNALYLLLSHDWPGNVRELQNLIERALIFYQGGAISFQGLLEKTSQINGPAVFSDKPPNLLSMDDAMSIHINTVLKHTNGKISGPGGAAEILGLPYSTLRHRMHKLGIHSGKRKGSSFQKIN
jgi:transcriptional regulator with PAS, ATPase and Fis domain